MEEELGEVRSPCPPPSPTRSLYIAFLYIWQAHVWWNAAKSKFSLVNLASIDAGEQHLYIERLINIYCRWYKMHLKAAATEKKI